MVFKKVTLVGESNENFEGAVEEAVDRAEQTIDNLRWAEVVNQSVVLEGADRLYQVEIEVAFKMEDSFDRNPHL